MRNFRCIRWVRDCNVRAEWILFILVPFTLLYFCGRNNAVLCALPYPYKLPLALLALFHYLPSPKRSLPKLRCTLQKNRRPSSHRDRGVFASHDVRDHEVELYLRFFALTSGRFQSQLITKLAIQFPLPIPSHHTHPARFFHRIPWLFLLRKIRSNNSSPVLCLPHQLRPIS